MLFTKFYTQTEVSVATVDKQPVQKSQKHMQRSSNFDFLSIRMMFFEILLLAASFSMMLWMCMTGRNNIEPVLRLIMVVVIFSDRYRGHIIPGTVNLIYHQLCKLVKLLVVNY